MNKKAEIMCKECSNTFISAHPAEYGTTHCKESGYRIEDIKGVKCDYFIPVKQDEQKECPGWAKKMSKAFNEADKTHDRL